MHMSRFLRQTTETPGSARERGVARVIARIKAKSTACVDVLFHDGTAESPNAGILGGDGFSYDAGTCTGICNGGNAGRLEGNGGNGYNGGSGGNAGWYAGIAGNGGDANFACTNTECRGGDGGRA